MLLAAVAAAGVGGCMPCHCYYRPEGETVERLGADFGCRYEIPPGSKGGGARLTVSTDGAVVVRNRAREKVLVVRIRLGVENGLDKPVQLEARSTRLVDSNGIIFPVKYVTASGLSEDGSVAVNGRAGADVYFELGPPAVITRLGSFSVGWQCSVESKPFSGETKFVRFTPARVRRYCDPWLEPWPSGWIWLWGVGLGHRYPRTSSPRWGP